MNENMSIPVRAARWGGWAGFKLSVIFSVVVIGGSLVAALIAIIGSYISKPWDTPFTDLSIIGGVFVLAIVAVIYASIIGVLPATLLGAVSGFLVGIVVKGITPKSKLLACIIGISICVFWSVMLLAAIYYKEGILAIKTWTAIHAVFGIPILIYICAGAWLGSKSYVAMSHSDQK